MEFVSFMAEQKNFGSICQIFILYMKIYIIKQLIYNINATYFSTGAEKNT